jgi:hypothetical protein
MSDTQSSKHAWSVRRLLGGKTEHTIEKLTLIGMLAAAGAEWLRASSRNRKYTDDRLQRIARSLNGQLGTILMESSRLERALKTREGKQSLPLAMALATIENFAALLEGALFRATRDLNETNPELKAVTTGAPVASGVRSLPEPQQMPAERIVDADPALPGADTSLPGFGTPSTVTQPLVPSGPPPSLANLSDRQRLGLAEDLRVAFTEIICGVQYVQATIGEVATTNSIKIDTAVAQAHALVTGLRDRDHSIREKYSIG